VRAEPSSPASRASLGYPRVRLPALVPCSPAAEPLRRRRVRPGCLRAAAFPENPWEAACPGCLQEVGLPG